MRHALISLIIYVVPLPVLLGIAHVVVCACDPSTWTFLLPDKYVTPVMTPMYMFRFDGGLRSLFATMLLGAAFWALHQSLRALAFTLQRMRPTSCA